MSELKSRVEEHNPDPESPKLLIKFTYIPCVAIRSFPKSMKFKKIPPKNKTKRKILSRIPVLFRVRSVLSEQY